MQNSIIPPDRESTPLADTPLADTPLAKKDASIQLRVWRLVGVLAVGLLILLGAYAAYVRYTPQSTLYFDVNPSVMLSLNRADRVLKMTPLDEEGRVLVNDLEIHKKDLHQTVQALIAAMAQEKYFDSEDSAVLITVQSKRERDQKRLQERVTDQVTAYLQQVGTEAAVMSQASLQSEEIKMWEREYGISAGKASLIARLVQADASVQADEWAGLPIREIRERVNENNLQLDIHQSGGTSSIHADQALQAALRAAGVSENEISKLEIEREYEKGRRVFEVEFYVGQTKYEYDIDAVTGVILDADIKPKPTRTQSGDSSGTTDPHQPPADAISMSQALAIALRHLGVTESQIAKLEIEREREDGKWIYEVEFIYQGKEYEYEIDAVSGEILEISIESLPDSSGEKPQSSAPTAGAGDEIDTRQALAIALRHLGVTESQIAKLEIEREREDGKWIYEVEFIYQGKEYEYEIDAVSGEVLEVTITQ